MITDILYKLVQICLYQVGVSKLVSTPRHTILSTDALLDYRERRKNDAKKINYLAAALTQLTITYYYFTQNYDDVFSLLSSYFIWDIFYINFVEPSFYSTPLIIHHIVSLLCLMLSWIYVTPETVVISTHVCQLFEASNFWDNITFFLILQNSIKKNNLVYFILRSVYLIHFAYDRFYNFPVVIY